MVKIW